MPLSHSESLVQVAPSPQSPSLEPQHFWEEVSHAPPAHWDPLVQGVPSQPAFVPPQHMPAVQDPPLHWEASSQLVPALQLALWPQHV
jgi:hypothetical protein